MDGAQVGILEQSNQVGLGSLLKGHDSRGLETQVSLEILSDFADQTLEWELPDQQFSRLLITADLTESHSAGTIAVRFLDTSGGRGRLASGLGSELLPRGLASSRFASGLLGTGHVEIQQKNRSLLFEIL